ncbi:BLOC-1-related complex subunit 8-like [Saccoglossus kowalevskii]
MDVDLDYKVKKLTVRFSENLHIVANEPSLALYRLQEHVRKTLPVLSDKRVEMKNIQQEVQGMCYDAEYATKAVKKMQNSGSHFTAIDEHLKKTMYLKQELDKVKPRRTPSISSTGNQPISSTNTDQTAKTVGREETPVLEKSNINEERNEAGGQRS